MHRLWILPRIYRGQFFTLQRGTLYHTSIYRDRQTYRFILDIFILIVMVPTYIVKFYSMNKEKKIEIFFRRDGRVVDSSGLENRYSSKQRTIEGSNPSLSFFLVDQISFFFLYIIQIFSFQYHKENGSAEWNSRARKKRIYIYQNQIKMS